MANRHVKTIKEAARETEVFHEADVIVVGGDPGGHAAAGNRRYPHPAYRQPPQ